MQPKSLFSPRYSSLAEPSGFLMSYVTCSSTASPWSNPGITATLSFSSLFGSPTTSSVATAGLWSFRWHCRNRVRGLHRVTTPVAYPSSSPSCAGCPTGLTSGLAPPGCRCPSSYRLLAITFSLAAISDAYALDPLAIGTCISSKAPVTSPRSLSTFLRRSLSSSLSPAASS